MKKILLFLVLLCSSVLAEGPLFTHPEPEKQQEFENVYQDLRHLLSTTNTQLNTNFIYNVKDFGAKGDGITNDYLSIQAALNISSGTSGGIVFFPSGTYIIGTKLVIYSSTTMMGSSYGSVILKAKTNLNDRIINNQGRLGTGTDTNVNLVNLVFDLNGTNQSGSTAPTFINVYGHNVINCSFINPYDSLYLLSGSPLVTVNQNAYYENVLFDGTGQVSAADVVDIGSGSNIRMTKIRAINAKTGTGSTMLSIAIANGFSITDSWLNGASNGATIALYGIQGGKIDGCEIFNSAEWGVRIQYWTEVGAHRETNAFDIINNTIHDNAFDGIAVYNQGGSTEAAKDVLIANNSIWNNQRGGVMSKVANGLKIINNTIWNNSLASAGTYGAFELAGGFHTATDIHHVQVIGNRIFDNQPSPKQTLLYHLDYVDVFLSRDNIFSNITTTATITNSTNYFIEENMNLSATPTNQKMFGVNTSVTGILTRDLSLASGSVSYTGVGFTPKTCTFISSLDGTFRSSIGSDDGTNHKAVSLISSSANIWTSDSIVAYDGVGANYVVAHITSMDADGFTIAWTKTGSPTGTFNVIYTATR